MVGNPLEAVARSHPLWPGLSFEPAYDAQQSSLILLSLFSCLWMKVGMNWHILLDFHPTRTAYIALSVLFVHPFLILLIDKTYPTGLATRIRWWDEWRVVVDLFNFRLPKPYFSHSSHPTIGKISGWCCRDAKFCVSTGGYLKLPIVSIQLYSS